MAVPIIRSSTDIRRDYNSIEKLAKETGKPIYLTKNGRASLVVIDVAAFDYDQYVGAELEQAQEINKESPQGFSFEEALRELDRLIDEKLAEHAL